MKILDRLPTLDEFFGPGARAEGFEEWCAETFALESAVEPEQQAALRMLRGMVVLCNETLRIECEQHERDAVLSILLWPRLAGIAIMSAAISVASEGSDARRLVVPLVEEFRAGLKLMADLHAERQVA